MPYIFAFSILESHFSTKTQESFNNRQIFASISANILQICQNGLF